MSNSSLSQRTPEGVQPTKRYAWDKQYRPLVSPPSVEDKDACAIYASVRKDATPSHEPVTLALTSLQKMLHRAGNVDGEGDGCGLLVDIPRKIWAEEVRTGGHNPALALDDAFSVAHVFVERSQDVEKIRHDAREILAGAGFRILAERLGAADPAALGPTAREEEPHFWQFAGLVPEAADSDRALFKIKVELEVKLGVHVASFSPSTCVYKVMGAPKVLGAYYPDLSDERFETIGCFGHNRYSTNTWPSFTRVQPFGVLGHNGEINTIEQLRQEARMLGIPIGEGNSDSQDLNRTIETLVRRDGLSLAEAMELVLPPVANEIRALPEELHSFYMYLREAFGPFSQGPVALIARHRDECVFSADALGLRPLWQLETPTDWLYSSEPGVAPVSEMISEPKPLAPGEKSMVSINRGKRISTRHEHADVLKMVRDRWLKRSGATEVAPYDRALTTGGPLEGAEIPGYAKAGPSEPIKVGDEVLAGFGWQRDDVKLVQQMASNGAEPIGSLGYDGPLAALSPERQNLADYFKETVAVVTNPAIDREREMEHFSTRSVFGRRPSLHDPATDTGTVETSFPVLLGGHHELAPFSDADYRKIAKEHQTYVLEDLWEHFSGRSAALDISLLDAETTQGAIERLRQEAVKKVQEGAELLVLTDRTVYEGERRYLDPHLATSAVDQALKGFGVDAAEDNLRRRCSIVLRSAAIRNVHDVALALGLGANGVCPYVMIEVVCVDDYPQDVANICSALSKGIEKVISTIGIHEVRGYARQFSSIGIKPELAEIFQTEHWAASRERRHWLLRPRRRYRAAPADPQGRGSGEAGEDLPLLSEGLQGGGRRLERLRRLQGVRAEGPRPRGREPDLDAPHHGPQEGERSRTDRSQQRRRRRRPPRLPDGDLLDELRLAVRARVPRLRRGRQGDQHPLHQRGGRGDPGHVRRVPQVARPAGRLGPLRGLGRDDQLLLRRRDQDRPGREARRGRPPAGQEGLREGRRGP